MHILRHASISDLGPRRRTNEDAVLAADPLPLFAVADGTGGSETAKWVVNVLHDAGSVLRGHGHKVRENDGSTASRLAIGAFFENAFERASQRIRTERTQQNRGAMAASAVAATVLDKFAYVAHVGDTRAYLLRAGDLRCLTTDHTLAMLQLQRGEISPSEFQTSPFRHTLSQALGVSPDLNVDIAEIRLMHGDILVLCSNGLTRVVNDGQILRLIRDESVQAIPDVLTRAAREAGGRDNVSIVALEVGADEEKTEPSVANVVDIVRQVFLFKLLSEPQWLSVAPYIEEKTFRDGEVIFREGDDSDLFFIIGDGAVEKLRGSNVIESLGSGDCFGELALAGPNQRTYTAVVSGKAVCFAMSRASFLKIVNHKPILGSRLSLALIRGLGQRLIDSRQKISVIRQALGG